MYIGWAEGKSKYLNLHGLKHIFVFSLQADSAEICFVAIMAKISIFCLFEPTIKGLNTATQEHQKKFEWQLENLRKICLEKETNVNTTSDYIKGLEDPQTKILQTSQVGLDAQ